jgi:hypothetical protein
MSLKKDLIDKQARFWVLMAGGATLTRASETVGVSRATGRCVLDVSSTYRQVQFREGIRAAVSEMCGLL